MKIFRAENPLVMRYMFEHLTVDSSVDNHTYAQQLISYMVHEPDNTHVCVMYEGDELVGFLIGRVTQDRPYLWLEQVWAKAEIDKQHKRETLDRVVDWAKELGCTELRFETERKKENIQVWKEAYDMIPRSVIMGKDI